MGLYSMFLNDYRKAPTLHVPVKTGGIPLLALREMPACGASVDGETSTAVCWELETAFRGDFTSRYRVP